MTDVTIEKVLKGVDRIAQICHDVNKAYCEALGDFSQPTWEEAPDWQKQSARDGVLFHINNPDAPPSASHDNWMALKSKEGWVYGPVKDAEKKEHPCMVPYDQLPLEQRAKDYIFTAVILALMK